MSDQKNGTIEEYISRFPEDIQKTLQKIRQTIRAQVPEATEKISYGIPSFHLNGHYLIYYSANKDHFGLYPFGTNDVAAVKGLEPYLSGKGTARFAYGQPFPYELLTQLVERRIADVQSR